MNYYNEFNPESAAMLRQMIADQIIPNGYVDERSITEVRADELVGYTQCHFFAGIGGWAIALGIAGYGDVEGIWTGSCPCQPFSTAGKRKGKDDDRHLWPVWFNLIKQCKPRIIFGEQVASAIGKEDKNLPKLLKRIGTLELLLDEAERQEILSSRLQGLRSKEKGSISQRFGRTEPFDSVEMERELERINIMLTREETGKGDESSIQPDSGMGSGENRQRDLRTDGDQDKPDRRENVGQPINRSDYSEKRVRDVELSPSDLFSERDDEQLGREQDYRSGQFYYGDQTEKLRRLASEARREFEETITKGWLDDVYEGLESQGYAVGSAVLPAASVGAPHKRDRLWFVADYPGNRLGEKRIDITEAGSDGIIGDGGTMANATVERFQVSRTGSIHESEAQQQPQRSGSILPLDHSFQSILEGHAGNDGGAEGWEGEERPVAETSSRSTVANTKCNQNNEEQQRSQGDEGERSSDMPGRCGMDINWSTGVWINCPDGKARFVEPNVRLLVDGVQFRRPLLHAFGNGIVAQLAAEFIKASF